MATATTDAQKILELQAALEALKESEAARVEAARVSAVSGWGLPPAWSRTPTESRLSVCLCLCLCL